MIDALTPMIASEAELRVLYKQPTPLAAAKEIGHIDRHCRRFIELSPFVCIGTMGSGGAADVSPRGGEPGFVAVLDESHLAIPDRPGNNRLDSLLNIVGQSSVGLLFFVPGFEDMLRVNGVARITTDATLLSRFVAAEKFPLSVMVIEVRQAQVHCTKAIKRASLWKAASQIDRRSFPTLGQVLHDQLALEREVAEVDDAIDKNSRNLY
jgi:hypothetical protein